MDLLFLGAATGVDDWEEWEFTDENGDYTTELAASAYLVLDDDHDTALVSFAHHPGQREYRLDLELPAGVVRGRVVFARDGSGVANATVHALRAFGSTDDFVPDTLSQGLLARSGRVQTDPEGHFELEALSHGKHLLSVEHAGIPGPAVRVVVTDAPLLDLTLAIPPGVTLHGSVRDRNRAPMSMELSFIPGNRLSSLAQLQMGGQHASGNDGTFRIEGVSPGPYVVLGRGETREHDLTLRANIHVRMGGNALLLSADRCGTLRVRVVHPSGIPAHGAFLELRAPDDGPAIPSLEWLEESPRSDREGRITLDDVAPGWYRVEAIDGVAHSASPRVEVVSEETTELTLVLGR